MLPGRLEIPNSKPGVMKEASGSHKATAYWYKFVDLTNNQTTT